MSVGRSQPSKGTGPERRLLAACRRLGLPEPEKNVKGLPGSPDLVWRKERVAVFVHGCFWHGCEKHWRPPRRRRAWWTRKIEKNKVRDAKSERRLIGLGWHVVSVWEHERPGSAARTVGQIIRERRMMDTTNATTLASSITFTFNQNVFRVGQQGAYETSVGRVMAGESHTSIILPTRYGKSHLMRLVAIYLWSRGVIAAALALSPNENLRDQLGAMENFLELKTLFGADLTGVNFSCVESVPGSGVPDLTANGEMFLSMTMQLAVLHKERIKTWAVKIMTTTGMPVLLFIDECHTGSEANIWGGFSREMAAIGVKIVLLTATAAREDNIKIEGFRWRTKSVSPVIVKKTGKASSPDLVRVDTYEGTREILELEADYEYTFGDAWNETPSPLCTISRLPFDVDMSKIKGLEVVKTARLSAMKSSEARESIGVATKDLLVVADGVRAACRELRVTKRVDKTCAMIVFCGNDNEKKDKETDKHARAIESAVREVAPDLVAIIATSSTDGKDKIKSFAKGLGDVLIVKQMASLGLDIPRLKVCLDLSAVRSESALIQRLMRIATPFNRIRTGTYVTPADPVAGDVFKRLVTDQGGEAKISRLELIDSHEIPKSQKEDRGHWSVQATSDHRYNDSRGTSAEANTLPVVSALLEVFPNLIESASHAQINEGADRVREILSGSVGQPSQPVAAEKPSVQNEPRDTGLERQQIMDAMNASAKELVNTFLRREKIQYSPNEYAKASKRLWKRAKKFAGVSAGTQIREITSIKVLTDIKNIMDAYVDHYVHGKTDSASQDVET